MVKIDGKLMVEVIEKLLGKGYDREEFSRECQQIMFVVEELEEFRALVHAMAEVAGESIEQGMMDAAVVRGMMLEGMVIGLHMIRSRPADFGLVSGEAYSKLEKKLAEKESAGVPGFGWGVPDGVRVPSPLRGVKSRRVGRVLDKKLDGFFAGPARVSAACPAKLTRPGPSIDCLSQVYGDHFHKLDPGVYDYIYDSALRGFENEDRVIITGISVPEPDKNPVGDCGHPDCILCPPTIRERAAKIKPRKRTK